MVLPNTSITKLLALHRHQGFTLLEVVVVVTMLATLASVIAFFSLGEYYSAGRVADVKTLQLALIVARTRALAGVQALPAGVALYPDGYQGFVVFSGYSYESRVSDYDERLPVLYGLELSPATPTVVSFASLSATTTPVTIVQIDPRTNRRSTTTITYDGYIE